MEASEELSYLLPICQDLFQEEEDNEKQAKTVTIVEIENPPRKTQKVKDLNNLYKLNSNHVLQDELPIGIQKSGNI